MTNRTLKHLSRLFPKKLKTRLIQYNNPKILRVVRATKLPNPKLFSDLVGMAVFSFKSKMPDDKGETVYGLVVCTEGGLSSDAWHIGVTRELRGPNARKNALASFRRDFLQMKEDGYLPKELEV